VIKGDSLVHCDQQSQGYETVCILVKFVLVWLELTQQLHLKFVELSLQFHIYMTEAQEHQSEGYANLFQLFLA
jgi:hypothetical protein